MSHYAQHERRVLADLLEQLGPDAPTLCAGWTTADLAAHLVVRERRPDAAVGIVVPALSAYTDKVQRAVRDGRSWPALVDAVRSGPPAPIRPVDEQLNTIEFFVHTEDVRRAVPDWAPRPLDPGMEAALWVRLRPLARLGRRRFPVGVTLDAPGHGRLEIKPGDPHVSVTGPPSELALFVSGRQGTSRVELSGAPEAVERLRGAPLGM